MTRTTMAMGRSVMGVLASTLAMAGCAGSSGSSIGSAVGGATGAVVGYQHGQAGLGKSVGSNLGSVAGSLTQAARDQRRASAPPVAQGASQFCPVGGEYYPSDVRFCPLHGAELRDIVNTSSQ